jgi:Ca2+-transporting ATPase
MSITPFHCLSPEQVMDLLETGPQGLSEAQAQERLERFGPNEVQAGKRISALRIFLMQFQNVLIVILAVATSISFSLGEHIDAWVILAILATCVLLGFVQEYRAEHAAAALQKMATPVAIVVRDGREQLIPA